MKTSASRPYEVLLAAVIIARSSSYLFSKLCLTDMGPYTLLALRFLLAFLLLVLFFGKKLRGISAATAVRGVMLGVLFFATMAAELFGLKSTDSATVSFLENTAIVFVPLFEAVLRRKMPTFRVLLCAVLALGGIALLTLKEGSFSLSLGECYCLLAAVLYAAAIIATDRFSHHHEPTALGIIQVGVIGFLGLIFGLFTETPRLPQTGMEWISLVYLAVICTGFGFTLQPVAQSRTSSEKAGIFCALNPLTATVLGVVFLHEVLDLTDIFGAVLILCGIVIYSVKKQAKRL